MIAAACRSLPLRLRRPPPSLLASSCSSSSPPSRSGSAGAGEDSSPLRRSRFLHGAPRDDARRRHRHQRRRRLSTTDAPSIEVAVTQSKDDEGANDGNADGASSSDGDEEQSSGSGPNLAKSPSQVIEEEILSLQSELRTRHRHADHETALSVAEDLLRRTSDHFGDLHPATASAHNNVGLMNKLLGRYSEAREAYHEILRVYGEVCGKDHASYAAALSNLGMLERGRVLESEAGENDEEDGGGKGGEGVENEDNVELEELRDGNPPEKERMTALDRMQLNESAIEYFDEAYRIRLSELGPHHPHTITSQSQLGSAMAAAVIAERKGRIGGLVEAELRKLKQSKDVKDAGEMEAHIPEAVAKAAAKTSTSKLTRRRMEAAESHLRGALDKAVENPRGESVGPLTYIPVSGAGATEEGGGLTLPPKKDRSLPKKERKRMAKERKRERRMANANALQGAAGSKGEKVAVQGVAGKVTTLSAATAAQNLAVFLKNYSDWMRLTLTDEADAESRMSEANELEKTVREARHLYESALHVRSSILPSHHPEVVATKFSLAELLDSPRVDASASASGEEEEAVDGKRANALREEILEAYDVVERE